MKKAFALFCFSFVFFFTSCRSPFGEKDHPKPKPVAFEFSSQQNGTTENYFTLTIDSLNNYLLLSFTPNQSINKFPFPKDKNGTLLSSTCFSFVVLNNNVPLENAGLPLQNHNYFGYNKWLGKNVCFKSDTVELSAGYSISFQIPFYALNKLKAGVNELELLCTQQVFCSGVDFKQFKIDGAKKDTTVNYIRHYANASLISLKAKFKINVPQIFRTTIYGYGIELRNDSVYSPAGMDNTIWNSSYPDIYWTIQYPEREFYCSSDYQTSTAHYDARDTFQLYHYTPYDSISLGVWDHDNLSRDDYISYQKFSLKQFPNNKIAKIRFDNVKCFELRMVKGYAVNR